MSYRDDLAALRTRHDELARELSRLQQEQQRLQAVASRAAELEAELAELRNRLEQTQRRRSLPLLDDLRVASPCSESWDEMIGDERVRFCCKCDKNVYDVSAMTRDEAEALIARSEGGDDGLCLRMYRRKDGTVLTADCPVGRRRRRVTRVAAAALAFGGGALALAAYERSCVMGVMAVQPPVEPPTEQIESPEPWPEPGTYVMGDVATPVEAPAAGEAGAEDESGLGSYHEGDDAGP